MNLLFKNVRLIEPYLNIDKRCYILVESGVIISITDDMPSFNFDVDIIEGKNLLLTNGFLDMHVHFRDPGFTYKEDIISGSKSASSGGFTAVCPMPNTHPVIDNLKTLSYVNEKSKSAYCKIFPICAVTNSQDGIEMVDFSSLKESGAVAFSDDGRPVANNVVLEASLNKSLEKDFLIISHCEDLKIIDGGIINKGVASETLKVKGMDRLSEDISTKREIDIAEKLGSRIHIAHVSTKGSVEIIRYAKKRGVRVTCETCPHYFWLTDESTLTKDADYRMNPPLREKEDINAIIDGIKDGTIDVLVTDHAPHSEEDKKDFYLAPNGVIGLETCFSAAYTKLVLGGYITLNHLIKMLTVSPYNILNLSQRNIKVGEKAEFTVIDLDKKWTVDKKDIISKSKNAVFKGMEFSSKVIYTCFDGKTSYSLFS